MKVYISSDIEGCVGVTTWCETENGQEDYESACRQMTLETAAACEAAMEMGFTPWIPECQCGYSGIQDTYSFLIFYFGAIIFDGSLKYVKSCEDAPQNVNTNADESFLLPALPALCT